MSDWNTWCWSCSRPLTLDVDEEAERPPRPGDLAVCGYCGAPAIVGDDLSARHPDPEIMARLAANPVWAARLEAAQSRARKDDPDHEG